MSKRRCSIMVAIVLLAGALSARVASAAMSAEEIELRKKVVIHESLQKLGQPTENLALLEAAVQAEALLEIKIERDVRETRVSILTTGEPAYESFPLNDRQRIVIDVYNTINFHSGDTYETLGPSVLKSVRTSLFQLEPQFTSRIVLDLEKMVEVQVAQQGEKIEVVVPEDIEVPVAAPAAPEEPAELAQIPAEVEAKEVELAEEEEQPEVKEVEVAQVVEEIEPEPPAEELALEQEPAEQEEPLEPVAEVDEQEEATVAEAELEQIDTALASAAEEAKAEKEAETADLREQLSHQKEAYAQLKTSLDDEFNTKISALEQTVKAELERKEQDTIQALEAQKAAIAELEDSLVSELAAKAELAKQLEEAREAPSPERGRKQVTSAAAPDLGEQTVTLNFRDADLGAVLDILARKADINLLAGGEVTGTVTAMLDDVPLMKAMELVLRENGYGIVCEEGIYRVVPLQLAEEMGAATTTEIFRLEYAKASQMAEVLKNIVTAKGKVAADDNANIAIVTDDPANMTRIADVIQEIDVPQTIVDTVTSTFRLSYLNAVPTSQMLEKMVTEFGNVIADATTNSLILTDVPANFQIISDLVAELDQRPDQVYIEVLIVDAVLSDGSQFGVAWLAEAVRVNRRGNVRGNVSELTFETDLGNIATDALDAGILTLGILGGDFNLEAVIAAEVQTRDATILADPKILVLNNETATIEIVTEVPFQEITQSTQGPPVASTEFKDIGTTLQVTPRITREGTVILRVRPEESSISGVTDDGIPIEDSRRAETSILLSGGQTAVVGGLRNAAKAITVSKVPWLGDIPYFGRLFRHTVTTETNTELLLFLTVHIVKGVPPELTPYERSRFTEIDTIPRVPDAQKLLWEDTKHPWGKREPFWKRRTKNVR